MNKNILSGMIFGAALLLFAACTQDELTEQAGTLPEGMYPLEISSVTLGAEVSSQPWGANVPQTRVSENTDRNSSKWDGGEVITVQLGDNKAPTTTYEVKNTDGMLELTGNQLYWAKREDKVTAWYPENGTIPLSNQLGGLAYVLQATAEKAAYDKPVALDFSHQLAKIRVVLEGEKAGDVKNVKIESYTSCTNTNGTVSTDGVTVGEITMYHLNGTNIYEANVVPGKTIKKFKVNNGDWVVLSPPVTPVYGKYHEINITVNEKVVEVNLDELTGPYTIGEDCKYILTGSTTQRIIINADATVVLKGVSINTSSDGAPIQISGYHTATLMLEGNNNTIQSNVEKYPAILPDQGSTVVIDGTGSLKAQGSFSAAGIGSGGIGQFAWETISAGYIKILGGNVEAIGGTGGTGIGCGYYGNCQGVEILGGTVTARAGGGYDNPAIGSSTAGDGTCEYVKLERCTINAHPSGAAAVVANSVTPSINDSGALATAGVTLNVN